MKPTICAWLLAAAVLLCVFAGCQAELPGGSSGGDSSDFASAGLPAESSEPSDDSSSGEEILLPEDFFTMNGQGVLPTQAQIPDYCMETEEPFLYRCPFASPGDSWITLYQNDQAIAYSDWLDGVGNRVQLYAAKTGQLLWNGTLPDWCEIGLLDSGELWCLEYTGLRVTAYGKDGEMGTLRDGGPESGEGLSCGTVTPDGRYCFAADVADAELLLLDLTTGERKTAKLPNNDTYWTVLRQENETVWLTDYGYAVLEVNLADGTLVQQSFAQYVGGAYGTILHLNPQHGVRFWGAETGGKQLYVMLPDASETLLDVAFGCAVTARYEPDANGQMAVCLQIYDLRKGILLRQLCLQYGMTEARWQSDGSLLIVRTDSGITDFFRYDLPAAVKEGTANEPLEVLFAFEEELLEATDRLAGQLRAETGVELYYGSRGNDFICNGYVGVVELDPYTVYRAVKETAEVLACYPEGMLRETYSDTHTGLSIYLCSTLYGVGYGGLDVAGGLTTDYAGEIVVALDIANGVSNTLHHELSHVFDRRISYAGLQSGQDWMAWWTSLTPYADAYTYGYEGYYGHTRYVASYEKNADRVWFSSPYARTFETEDRACLMELMFSDPDQLLSGYPHLMEKAKAYAYMLRQCFPSCAAAGTLPWEPALGVIDETAVPVLPAA